MAIVDHKWEMRVEVGRGAFAIVELVRHPKNDIAMILKTVSKKIRNISGKTTSLVDARERDLYPANFGSHTHNKIALV